MLVLISSEDPGAEDESGRIGNMPHRVIASAMAVMFVLTAAACGGSSEAAPVKIGAAPTQQTPVSLPAVAPGGGLAPLDRWPSGCSMLTDADIKAILPQAEKFERETRSGDVRIFDELGRPTREDTAKESGCGITFWLPKQSRTQKVPSVSMSVIVEVVGTPSVVNLNWSQLAGRSFSKIDSYSADECKSNQATGQYRCRKGGMSIALVSDAASLYIAEFENQTGEGRPAMVAHWQERVVPELLKAITGKMP